MSGKTFYLAVSRVITGWCIPCCVRFKWLQKSSFLINKQMWEEVKCPHRYCLKSKCATFNVKGICHCIYMNKCSLVGASRVCGFRLQWCYIDFTVGLWYFLKICQTHSCIIDVKWLPRNYIRMQECSSFLISIYQYDIFSWPLNDIPVVCLLFLCNILLKCTIGFLSLGGVAWLPKPKLCYQTKIFTPETAK